MENVNRYKNNLHSARGRAKAANQRKWNNFCLRNEIFWQSKLACILRYYVGGNVMWLHYVCVRNNNSSHFAVDKTKRKWRLIKSRKEAIRRMVQTMMIHGVGIFVFVFLCTFFVRLCVCFVVSFCVFQFTHFRLFHLIEYAILFLPIRLLAESFQPKMLKHLTERQKSNLIKQFREREKKIMWNSIMCTCEADTQHIHLLAHSQKLTYIYNGLPP